MSHTRSAIKRAVEEWEGGDPRKAHATLDQVMGDPFFVREIKMANVPRDFMAAFFAVSGSESEGFKLTLRPVSS